MVNLWNRAGNTNAGESAREFFEQTLKSLGQNFKVKKVLCDSGFYLIKFIEYIEQRDLNTSYQYQWLRLFKE